jgi:hypothetical protein
VIESQKLPDSDLTHCRVCSAGRPLVRHGATDMVKSDQLVELGECHLPLFTIVLALTAVAPSHMITSVQGSATDHWICRRWHHHRRRSLPGLRLPLRAWWARHLSQPSAKRYGCRFAAVQDVDMVCNFRAAAGQVIPRGPRWRQRSMISRCRRDEGEYLLRVVLDHAHTVGLIYDPPLCTFREPE